MGILDGKTIAITGAGGGLGREHALLVASEGANVIVNDLGGTVDGQGDDKSAAQIVVDEIIAAGGNAVGNFDNIATMEGAQNLLKIGVETFGDVTGLVNNAGILRDKMLVNMSEQEWDSVINVHLRGHFCPTQVFANYWRAQTKEGKDVKATLVHTTSTSGLLGNVGQTNYGAAKAGIATFSQICAMELDRYGVRSNAIAPAARTRMTEHTPGMEDMVAKPEDENVFDAWNPANVSPMIAFLSSDHCDFTGETFLVSGGLVQKFVPWSLSETQKLEKEAKWTPSELVESFSVMK
jgi:NAD(P)-dependent dehydrogenase (short-subunit alcohol dehydrogenase family)